MKRFFFNGREINPGTSEKAKEKTQEYHDTFRGDSLEVSDIQGDISIQPSSKEGIEISATGPALVIKKLKITERGGRVSISGVRRGSTHISSKTTTTFTSNIYINGKKTVISDGDVVIDDNNSPHLNLAIKAPVHTGVDISDVIAKIDIGDLKGDLTLDLSGNNSVHATSVRDLDVDASGSYQIKVDGVDGDVNLDLSGVGFAELSDGNIGNLDIDASGMCKVDAQVTAKHAQLDASGMSRIYVKKVTDHCSKDSSGMSSVTIG